RAARKLESFVQLWSVKPSAELLSGCDPNEAYVAADEGRAYVVYFPAGGEVRLDMTDAEHSFIVNWINIDTGQPGPKHSISGGGKVALASPGAANWVAAILAP
ncbi:MAG: hypothetical protein GY748_24610, partial [Planctomycetaceae bacterium]|nr:hypothetical protein [Planctomycetaceae bacterium]